MRLVTFALLATAALGSTACHRGPSVDLKNATPADVSKAIKAGGAGLALVRPGKWSSTVTIAAIDTARLSPIAAAGLNAQVGKPHTTEACITPELVNNPERMLARVPANCRYEHYRMGGGQLDGHLVCSGGGGAYGQDMTVKGTYGNDQYGMTIATITKAGPEEAAFLSSLSSTMKISAHRLGDCDAKTAG